MRIVRPLFIILWVVLAAWRSGTAVAQTVVTFPDQNLEAAIRSALAKPAGSLTSADLNGLHSLFAGRLNVVNLSGLEWAVNLASLDLSGNSVSDLSPLAGLTNLSYMELRSNPLTNFSAVLIGLTNLTTLYLGATSVSNLNFLQNLTQLSFINLDHNEINNLSPLATLPNLQHLDLGYNPLTNLTELSTFTNLRSLYLSGNSISNISGLAGLSQLTSLTLYNNRITDLSPLAGLTNLDSLGLSRNPVGDHSALGGLTNLTSLWLAGNSVSNLDFVVGLKSLEVLGFSGGRLTELVSLQGLTNLAVVFADYNHLTNINGIHNLPHLFQVGLVGNTLDLSAGSSSAAIINDLLNRQVNVVYLPQNQSPAIFISSHWVIATNAISTLEFYVIDDVTPDNHLLVEASSSNTDLIPNESISLSSGNNSYTLTLAPAANQTGLATITIRATDEAGSIVNAAVQLAVVVPQLVPIPDPNLETIIRTTLDIPNGNLTSLDLLGLTSLGLFDANVTNLSGLEWATNLIFFSLDNNVVPDLSPLTSLSNLAGLHLQGASFNNLAPLQQLPQLKSLELDNNRIFDLLPLVGLTNLNFISLRLNLITDLAPLLNLPQLARVDVAFNLLDLSLNSSAMMGIETLGEHGVVVNYQPQRGPPGLSVRPAWVIVNNATSSLSFGVKNEDVVYEAGLILTARSSNTNLLPNGNVVIGKSANADWFLHATPTSNQVGTTTITLTATNDVGMGTSVTVLVTVTVPLPLNNQLLGGGNLIWSTGGNASWFGQTAVSHEGGSAAQSGSVQNGQQTIMQTTIEGPGSLTFWWKVSSELNYDWLELRVNGQLQPGRISGEVDWEQKVMTLPRGTHVVCWRYFKEGADSSGLDTAWVDQVSFTPLCWLELVGSPTNGQCQLLLHPVLGRLYQLQTSTNLVHWVPLAVMRATNNAMSFLDVSANFSKRFYRLQELNAGSIWLRNPKRIGNEFQLEIHSPTGLRFEVQASADLINWSGLGVVSNALGQVQVNDSVVAGTPRRFYRVLLLP